MSSLSRSSSVSSWTVDQPTSGLTYSDSVNMTSWFPPGVTLMDLLDSDGLVGMSVNPPKTSPFGTWNTTGSDSGFCSSPSLDGASSGSNDPGPVSLQKSYKIWGDLNVDVDNSSASPIASAIRTHTASCWPDLTSLVICAEGNSGGVAALLPGEKGAGASEPLVDRNVDKGEADITLGAEASDVEDLASEIQEKIHKLLDDEEDH